MDFSLGFALYLLGAISGTLVTIAALSGRPTPDLPPLPPENAEQRARRAF